MNAWDGNGYQPETVQTPAGPFTTTFTFPWTSPPLHLNQRWPHRAMQWKTTRDVRSLMHAMARHLPEMDHIDVHLIWVVGTKHRRDGINATPTLKALVDGLVDAEVIPDDTPEYLSDHIPEIRYEKGCTAHFELVVTEVLSHVAGPVGSGEEARRKPVHETGSARAGNGEPSTRPHPRPGNTPSQGVRA